MRINNEYAYCEITRKQVNVIYGANKRGDVNVNDKTMKWFYNQVDAKAYIVVANTDQLCDKIADNERNIKDIIDAIFKNDFAKAQTIIDGIANYIAEIDEGAKRLIENEKARKERRALRKQGKALPTSASNSQWQAERKHHDKNANYLDGIE